jgi:glutaredoxin
MSAHPNNPLTTSETDAAGGQVSGQTSSQVDGQTRGQAPKARVYRMMIGTHVCPFGLKAKHLLKSRGFEVEDHPLLSREEVDTFKAQHDVPTTPQVFIGDQRIGGYDDLRTHFQLASRPKNAVSYRPIIALFSMAFLMALAISSISTGSALSGRTIGLFVAISMCLLALQKLQDVEGFSSMFLGYDLLARRWVPYSYLYPFLEGGAGILMLAGALVWLAAPVALVIGTIGAASVFKAVYVDKRELKCACVGGSNNVPLGFVSLIENVGMVLMALWMFGSIA